MIQALSAFLGAKRYRPTAQRLPRFSVVLLLVFWSPLLGYKIEAKESEDPVQHKHETEKDKGAMAESTHVYPAAVVSAANAVYSISYDVRNFLRVGGAGGSGFFISPDIFVTNLHCIDYDKDVSEARLFRQNYYLGSDSEITPFQPKALLAISWLHDLALIQVEAVEEDADTAVLSPASIKSVESGDDLYMIGYPGDSQNQSISKTFHSNVFEIDDVGLKVYFLFDTVGEAFMSRRDGISLGGASGSPVLDSRGNYVGVAFAATARIPKYFGSLPNLHDDLKRFQSAAIVLAAYIVGGEALVQLARNEIGTTCEGHSTSECIAAELTRVRGTVNDFIAGEEIDRSILGISYIANEFVNEFGKDTQVNYIKSLLERFDNVLTPNGGLEAKFRDAIAEQVASVCEEARNGNAHAQYECGLEMIGEAFSGRGGEEIAIQWLRAAAVQGHADAQYQLGLSFSNKDDDENAIPWLKMAMDQGHKDAQYSWMKITAYRGSADAKYAMAAFARERGDNLAAEDWIFRAANAGHALARYEMALILRRQGAVTDVTTPWLRMAAEQGHGDAQHDLGAALEEDGKGEEAVRWYTLAAKNGHVAAQYKLGTNFHGEGKTEEAVRWFKLAAGKGNAEAQNDLGVVFLEQERSAEAIRWFEQAAEQGLAVAQNNLGGVLRDEGRIEESVPWFKLAAEQGDADAQFNLGVILLSEGKTEESVPWFRLAAERGDADALYNLGLALFMQGETEEAARWLKMAADGGSEEAQTYFGFLIPRE